MSDPAIVSVFSQPQLGGDLPYFKGKQYGTGFIKEIQRVAFPILVQAGKTLARVAVNTMSDYLNKNKDLGEALKENATTEFNEVKEDLKNVFGKKRKQSGAGMNKLKKRKKTMYTIFDKKQNEYW